jgi:cell division protein FtsI (penicillin-binding protein 3)
MNKLKVRLLLVCMVLGLGGAAVIFRLFTIQVLDSKRYSERSRNQSQLRQILIAKRGTIYDCNGKMLALTTEKKVMLKPGDTKDGANSTNRIYPLGDIAGSVLGYVGRDGYGLGGVEFAYDNYLRGEDGWIILQKDGKNHKYRKIGLPERDPVPGDDIYLTIDASIQKITQAVLRQTVENFKAKGGWCIVMDPSSGKILAMANEPSFDPNFTSMYSMADRQNKCISYTYEPGSTFKVITASTALQEGIKKENDLIDGNNGRYEIFHQVIRDHEPYGLLTFTKALSYSSNVCFAQIANEIGNEKLFNYTKNFGFGIRSGIDLPGEEVGIVHPVSEWSGRSRVTVAIGQELSVTLLQITLAYAAVANGGVLVEPVICDKIVDENGKVVDSATYKPVRRVLKEDIAKRLRTMLADVAADGTGKKAAIEGIVVGGKTGTAQKPDSGKYSRWRSWSSFIGFIPADKPELLCSVVIDEPAGGEMGGVAAAPAFNKIMTQIISHPELHYAEKILGKNSVVSQDENTEYITVPVVSGLTKDSAEKILKKSRIQYQFAGSGKIIMYQTPKAGAKIDRTRMLTAYFDNSSTNQRVVPDCKGKDLRDAVNLVNLNGLTPYIVGFGKVKKQFPEVGTMMHAAEACTLICASD